MNKRCFEVETPLGTLKVWTKHESDHPDDYPGVYVDLIRDGKEDVLLTCVEFESCWGGLQTCVYGNALDDSPTDIIQHYNLNEEED